MKINIIKQDLQDFNFSFYLVNQVNPVKIFYYILHVLHELHGE
jgi:hypothetical protein